MKSMFLVTEGSGEGIKIVGRYDESQQGEAMGECERLTKATSRPHHCWSLFGVCRPVTQTEWESPSDGTATK